ncbi:hypothetical protein DPMN_061139 [Dreissena polymorpha]|uniref:Uncharacterized protein n=1 Tax=Dreissena polymorpha TaxID=45954 RepID=A0A9D4C766_DREPO|nr:hypothetical protein DPMN_061139 [Dreissena polymorpha]
MRTSIKTDIETCTESIKIITCLHEDLLKTKDKSEALNFIKYRKCLDQSLKVESVLQDMTTKTDMTLTFKPDKAIQQTLSTLSGLGQVLRTVEQLQPAKRTTLNTNSRQNKHKETSQSDPGNHTTSGFKVKKSHPESRTSRSYRPGNQTSDLTKSCQVSNLISSSSQQPVQGHQPGAVSKSDQIIKVKSSKRYSVAIKGDEYPCHITSICETSSGELLITDQLNCKVKLLDKTYKVVAHCVFSSAPWYMCSIHSLEADLVAVTVGYNQVHFIRVKYGYLIQDRIRTLPYNNCRGIANQHGILYITDDRALNRYTVDGSLSGQIYKDTSYRSCNNYS